MMRVHQTTGTRKKIPAARLRQISVALMLLAVLIVVLDGVYIFTALSAAPAVSVSQPHATPTLSPLPLYTSVTGKKPTLDDALDGKQPTAWGVYQNAQSAYIFKNQALHATMTAGIFPALIECPLRTAIFRNFAVQVQITILQGSQSFVGLFFRADPQVGRTYRFYTDFYGDAVFATEQRGEPVGTNLAVFQAGLQTQKSLMLTVIARDSSFVLYLDQRYLRTVTDASYLSGELGFFVSRGDGEATDVAFRQAKVWTL
jgi:hypothetical protein